MGVATRELACVVDAMGKAKADVRRYKKISHIRKRVSENIFFLAHLASLAFLDYLDCLVFLASLGYLFAERGYLLLFGGKSAFE